MASQKSPIVYGVVAVRDYLVPTRQSTRSETGLDIPHESHFRRASINFASTICRVHMTTRPLLDIRIGQTDLKHTNCPQVVNRASSPQQLHAPRHNTKLSAYGMRNCDCKFMPRQRARPRQRSTLAPNWHWLSSFYSLLGFSPFCYQFWLLFLNFFSLFWGTWQGTFFRFRFSS